MTVWELPTCPEAGGRDDCEFSFGMMMTTCMAYTPTYSRNGKRTNKDPNTTSGTVFCSKCRMQWGVSYKDGEPASFGEPRYIPLPEYNKVSMGDGWTLYEPIGTRQDVSDSTIEIKNKEI